MAKNNVVIYSTPSCHYCTAAKSFFQEHGVDYTEHNVASDTAKRKEMVERTGQMGVPVIVINNQDLIGFDQEKVEELLGLK